MRAWKTLFYFLLVLLFQPVAWGEVNVAPAHVYGIDVLFSKPLQNSTWLGIYGSVGYIDEKPGWEYYYPPFAKIDNLYPTSAVREAELNLLRTTYIGYPSISDPFNWYVVLSTSPDVNLYDLNSSCEKNLDELIEGNFCNGCIPSRTYETNQWIRVNDKNLCARIVILYGSVASFLLEWNDSPVYLTPVQPFELNGSFYNFAFLVSADSDVYLYLTRMTTYCGDGVCDPGEELNCGDCVSLELTVSPVTQEINLGETMSYTLDIVNDGNVDLNIILSVEQTAGGEGASCVLTKKALTIGAGSSLSQLITCGSSSAGSFAFRVVGTVGEVNVYSNVFYFVVSQPVQEENQISPAGGGGATTPREKNALPPLPEENKIVVTPKGYYIPWLGCISYIHVFSPDEVSLQLGEEKNVPVVIQNAGTCEENISFSVAGVEDNFYSLHETSFSLEKRKAKTIYVTFIGYKPGIYTAELVAKGYYTSKRKITIDVSSKGNEHYGCKSNILLFAPDVIEMVEGDETNTVLEVDNQGTCIEDVRLKLTKKSGRIDVLIDSRSFRLPGGEKFSYKLPHLAAGEYKLHAEAGGLMKDVVIIVRPRSTVENVVTDLMIRARFILLVIMLLVLLGAVSYIRQRYLS